MPERTSYAWALHPHAGTPERLTEDGDRGLDYAQRLASDTQNRVAHNLPNYTSDLKPLTLADLAHEEGVSVATITRRIALARSQLFGTLSDNAIYKRLQRQKQRRPRRTCAEPDCPSLLPTSAHANQKYCDTHRSPAARTRRHRANTHSERNHHAPTSHQAAAG